MSVMRRAFLVTWWSLPLGRADGLLRQLMALGYLQ